jgi:predicted transcriptional regulator
VRQAVPTIGYTIRLQSEIHKRLVERRRTTRVPTSAYIEQAIQEKLDRDLRDEPKRRAASCA